MNLNLASLASWRFKPFRGYSERPKKMNDSHGRHFRTFGFSGFPAFAIRFDVSVVCLRRPLNHADIVSTGKTPSSPRQVQSRKPETSKPRKKGSSRFPVGRVATILGAPAVFPASRPPWSGEGREAENTTFEGVRTVRGDRTCPRRAFLAPGPPLARFRGCPGARNAVTHTKPGRTEKR